MATVVRPGNRAAPSQSPQPSRRVQPIAQEIAHGDPARIIAHDGEREIPLGEFLSQVSAVAAALPAGRHVVNLCEDRYRFMVALCAVALRNQVTLLPSSRAPAVVDDVMARHADSWCLGDTDLQPAPPRYWRLPHPLPRGNGVPARIPLVADDALAAIGFTSGSTGVPNACPKTWGDLRISTAQNLAALQALWPQSAQPGIVATVPPQHMYGLELSILLPLLGAGAVHVARPFFPEDIACALRQVPAPRLLVTTPVHLRALLNADITLPPVAAIVSATAPLDAGLAAAAEARFATRLQEFFGSSETCILARRRTAREQAWTPLPGVRLLPQPDGALVEAPHLPVPVAIADLVEVVDAAGRFVLRGRNADLVEIAGKRASLGDLGHKLLQIAGVRDAVVFQADCGAGGVCRIAALVVAPGMTADEILAALRDRLDPAFLPRPLRCVDVLPRNATGKLPRDALLALLRQAEGAIDATGKCLHGPATRP